MSTWCHAIFFMFDRYVSLDFEDSCVAAAFVDRLEENRPKITVRSALQFASVYKHLRHLNCVDREGDVRWRSPRSALATVCLPGTCPLRLPPLLQKPTHCSSKEELVSARTWPHQMRHALSFRVFPCRFRSRPRQRTDCWPHTS